MKTVYIGLDSTFNSQWFASRQIKEWYFFSADYLKFYELEKESDGHSKNVDFGEILQSKAYQSKESYIDMIGQLGRKYTRFFPMAWWMSRVSEKNEMASNSFLKTCYSSIVDDILEKDGFKDQSLILVDSIALYKMFKKRLKKQYRVVILGKPYLFSRKVIRQTVRVLFCLYRFIMWMVVPTFKKIPQVSFSSDKKKVFLRTWVNDKTFGLDGVLTDTYFPGLIEFLKQKGYETVIIPNFHKISLKNNELVSRILKCPSQVFIAEKYLKLKDYLSISLILAYQTMMSFRGARLGGKDVSTILAETHRAHLYDQTYVFLSQMFALKNLSKQHNSIDSFIYTFENMFPEKPLSYAIKKYFPHSQSIGYQHSVLYPLQVCQYPSELEWENMPLPAKIVCSGPFFKNIFLINKAPEDKLVIGPALRFKNLISKATKTGANGLGDELPKNKILVAFPLAYPDALELAIKTVQSLKDFNLEGLKVGLKTHPMMNPSELKVIECFFPNQDYEVERVNISIDEALAQYSLLITMASGVVFDGIIEGLPVIRVGRSHSLNFDPADFVENNPFDYKAQTPKDLQALIQRLLCLDRMERQKILNFGKKFVKENFSPVNKETLSSFVA